VRVRCVEYVKLMCSWVQVVKVFKSIYILSELNLVAFEEIEFEGEETSGNWDFVREKDFHLLSWLLWLVSLVYEEQNLVAKEREYSYDKRDKASLRIKRNRET